MTNIQEYIIVQEGSLDHFPNTYHCSKCDARFKVLRDSVKTKVIHIRHCTINHGIATCPTKGCEKKFTVMYTTTTNHAHRSSVCLLL